MLPVSNLQDRPDVKSFPGRKGAFSLPRGAHLSPWGDHVVGGVGRMFSEGWVPVPLPSPNSNNPTTILPSYLGQGDRMALTLETPEKPLPGELLACALQKGDSVCLLLAASTPAVLRAGSFDHKAET